MRRARGRVCNRDVNLPDERNESPHMPPVIDVLRTELLKHKRFFNSVFQPEGKGRDQYGEEAAKVSLGDCGAEQSK